MSTEVFSGAAGEKVLTSSHKHINQSTLPPWSGGELSELFAELKSGDFPQSKAILKRLVGSVIEQNEPLNIELAESYYKLCNYFGLPNEGIKLLLRGAQHYLVDLYELSKSIHDVLRAYGLARTPFTRNEPDPQGVQTPFRNAVLLACDQNGLPAALWTPFGSVRIDSCRAGDSAAIKEAMHTLADKFQLKKHYPKFTYHDANHETRADFGSVFQLLINQNGQPLTAVCHASSAERLSLKWSQTILAQVRGEVLERTEHLINIDLT